MQNTSIDILSIGSRVEAPFVSVKMAGLTFGVYQKRQYKNTQIVDYPNFIQSLNIAKNANGNVNIYTLKIAYPVTLHDDPNFFEKVFSKAKKDRQITFSYGDYNVPNFIHKEEVALITKVKSSFNFSVINYTITAVSNSIQIGNLQNNFKAYSKKKPSEVIKDLLYSTKYGLTDIFYGMVDKQKVETWGLIPNDDQPVDLEAQTGVSTLEYLKYLVNSMRSNTDNSNTLIKNSIYKIAIYDDIKSKFGGPYFKIDKISHTDTEADTLDYITLDIGYPSQTAVISFDIDTDDTYSILYDFDESLEQNSYIYDIDSNGEVKYNWGTRLGKNNALNKMTEAGKSYWTNLTNFPITATLKLRGLLKNIVLMSSINVNIVFYGQSHIYSGKYIITAQTDNIDTSGYQTTLSLLRIGGINVN